MMNNPCLFMDTLGYRYEYIKGLVDANEYYKRVEEDRIVYTGDKYKIQFNLSSKTVVIIMLEDNAHYYGGCPTVFLDNVTLECINYIREKLGWRDRSYFDDNKD